MAEDLLDAVKFVGQMLLCKVEDEPLADRGGLLSSFSYWVPRVGPAGLPLVAWGAAPGRGRPSDDDSV